MNMCVRRPRLLILRAITLLAAGVPAVFAQNAQRYALILDDPPVIERFAGRQTAEAAAGRNYRQQIEARQQVLRQELATRNIQVTSSVSTVLNAIFVIAPADRLDELKNLPGVK